MKKEELWINITKNLNQLIRESNITIKELSEFTSVPSSTIYGIMNKHSSEPKLSTIFTIANFFNISVSQLIGEISLSINEMTIPLLSWDKINEKTGGIEIDVNTNNIKYISTDYETTNPMIALEFDNSLSYKYKDGGIILLEVSRNFKANEILLVCIEETKPVLKKVIEEGPHIFLESISHDIPAIKLNDTIKIIGIVREVRVPS